MKLSKTEQELLNEIDASPRKTTFIEWGLDRGRGGTGKLRPYGERRRKAALSLRDKGICNVVNSDKSVIYKNGYSSHAHTTVIARSLDNAGQLCKGE